MKLILNKTFHPQQNCFKRSDLLFFSSARLLIAVFLLAMMAPVHSDDSSVWSEYQGRMTREEAIAKCAGLGMRLPSIDELKFVYATGATKSWEKDTAYYWSSTANGAGIYCLHNIRMGGVCYGIAVDTAGVRCHR